MILSHRLACIEMSPNENSDATPQYRVPKECDGTATLGRQIWLHVCHDVVCSKQSIRGSCFHGFIRPTMVAHAPGCQVRHTLYPSLSSYLPIRLRRGAEISPAFGRNQHTRVEHGVRKGMELTDRRYLVRRPFRSPARNRLYLGVGMASSSWVALVVVVWPECLHPHVPSALVKGRRRNTHCAPLNRGGGSNNVRSYTSDVKRQPDWISPSPLPPHTWLSGWIGSHLPSLLLPLSSVGGIGAV